MSFIYPLFLVAGVALAIPVIIHLFNLRRYKTIYFPHTRFLKNIQLRSQKSSQIRYKLLLALRLLFLAVLILAFAQPFFRSAKNVGSSNRLQAIYIDNSGSMSLKKGPQRLIDIAKAAARKQVQNAVLGTKFLLLTNDRPVSYRPMPTDKMLLTLSAIDISPEFKNAQQVASSLQSIMQAEASEEADLYYYSDFQQVSVNTPPDEQAKINVMAVPVVPDEVSNVYIDTAYLANPVLQIDESNELIVHTRVYGNIPEEAPVLNLTVNGQIKSAATLNIGNDKVAIDTLVFRVNNAAWQKIELSVNDLAVRFDDTFRITARSAPSLSILALNERSPSPYIQAAFRAYNGFRLTNAKTSNPPQDWSNYSLVILNGATYISPAFGQQLAKAQEAGQTICIFPGQTNNVNALNEGLRSIGDITITGVDTSTETATSLQQGNELVRNLFSSIPDNVQLPSANWHYEIRSGITANRQSLLSFRNGDPLFAQFSPSAGQLYILSTSIDPGAGNFPSSYFFAPFLYQMAIQSNGGNAYAITLESGQPAYLPLNNASERNMLHLYHNGEDAIPPQRTQGNGLNVFIDDVVKAAGFYPVAAQGSDTTLLAVNENRQESVLSTTDISNLDKLWPGVNVKVITPESIGSTGGESQWGSFPLWKVCVILALILLAVETFVLAGGLRKTTAATQ